MGRVCLLKNAENNPKVSRQTPLKKPQSRSQPRKALADHTNVSEMKKTQNKGLSLAQLTPLDDHHGEYKTSLNSPSDAPEKCRPAISILGNSNTDNLRHQTNPQPSFRACRSIYKRPRKEKENEERPLPGTASRSAFKPNDVHPVKTQRQMPLCATEPLTIQSVEQCHTETLFSNVPCVESNLKPLRDSKLSEVPEAEVSRRRSSRIADKPSLSKQSQEVQVITSNENPSSKNLIKSKCKAPPKNHKCETPTVGLKTKKSPSSGSKKLRTSKKNLETPSVNSANKNLKVLNNNCETPHEAPTVNLSKRSSARLSKRSLSVETQSKNTTGALCVSKRSLSVPAEPGKRKLAIYQTITSSPKGKVKNEKVYEFQVDENEPQVKRKQRRILKFTKKRRRKPTNREESYIDNISKEKISSLWGSTDDVSSKLNSSVSTFKSDVATKFNSAPCHSLATRNRLHTPMFSPIKEEDSRRDSVEIPILFKDQSSLYTSRRKSSLPTIQPVYSAIDDSSFEVIDDGVAVSKTMCSSTPARPSLGIDIFHESIDDHNESRVSVFDKSNCFGFDELDGVEEPLLSPIRIKSAPSTSYSPNISSPFHGFPSPGPSSTNVYAPRPFLSPSRLLYQTPPKNHVQDVIQILKGSEDCQGTSEEADPFIIFDDLADTTHLKKAPRRSYTRPPYLRNLNKSFEEHSEPEEEDIVKHVKKKHHAATDKKPDKEFEKWAQAFNSQCAEVEKFDLVVE